MLKASLLFFCSLLCVSCQTIYAAQSNLKKHPDCTGSERWPTNIAIVHLKNSGLTSNELLDLSKTKTVRLASQKIEENLFRQVHLITFTEKSGKTIQAITVNDASHEECSMSEGAVFVVNTTLGK